MGEEEERQELRDPVVVEPRATILDPPLSDPVIFCPVGALTSLVARTYKAKKKLRPLTPARAYTIKHHGRQLSLVGAAMGAATAAMVLERVIANGVSKVIVLGLAGSLSPEVRIGDLVAPTEAWIEEGVSAHYVHGAPKSWPSESALLSLQSALTVGAKSYHLGPVWTTDAIFRETVTKVRKFQEQGVLAVEMETSALFTVAAYRKIDLAALLVISDELFTLSWRPGFTRPRFLRACRHASHLALAAALRLAGEKEPESFLPSEEELGPEVETPAGDDHEPT